MGFMMGIDAQIDAFFKPISDHVFSFLFYSVPVLGQDVKLLLVWLFSAAVFFTFYLGFVNFRYFGHAVNIVRGKYDRKEDDGEINSFQALMASMAGTVGLGNIAGVAVAVSIGGPGAVFWMVVMGVLCMSSKFAEVTLGVKYRHHESKEHPDSLSGGPMYFLKEGFAKRGQPVLGHILAVIFALACIGGAIGGANMFQANQAYQQLYVVTGGETGILADKAWLFGLGLAFITGIVIIGGIKSIANVSSRIVPIMALVYLGAGLVVIAMNYQGLPGAIVTIFSSALSLKAGAGAVLSGLLVGVQRAAFSNEAGLGSAAIVYSAARARHPVTQGMASMLGPFIDTVVICSTTGLMIVITGAYTAGQGMEGVELTSRAMSSAVSWFPYVLALSVFLFAYSSMITWAYYGVKCITFIFGQKDWLELAFKIFFCFCTVVGACATLDNLIGFTDALILSMAIPNILGLYVLAPEIKAELNDYIGKLKSGQKI
jgi:AGCS family alanine or glycine:cation symporter